MSLGTAVGRLRRGGLLNLTEDARRAYWILKSRCYYGPQFASFGRRSKIIAPTVIRNPGGMHLGDGVFIRDRARLEVVDRAGLAPGRLLIGDGVNIEQDVHITAVDEVEIGDHVCIAARCAIVGSAHPDEVPPGTNRAWFVSDRPARITIERGVFLGIGSVVLPGVTIGAGTIVGANSVVSRDIPAGVVAVGAPARPIRRLLGADERVPAR